MSHLFVELYEKVDDRFPCCILADHDLYHQRYFYDLHWRGVTDRAGRVVVRPGLEYRLGDHIRLLNQARPGFTDTIAVDPAIAADVDLDAILFNHHGFAGRAEAIMIVTNPNPDSSYRLRVSLYDQVGQLLPSFIFYDWECPANEPLVNLKQFHFDKKAAFIRVEPGPAYQTGDQVLLRETLALNSRTYALELGDYDLTQAMLPEEEETVSGQLVREPKYWAESLTGLELVLQPHIFRN
jgi:hypothetical protein